MCQRIPLQCILPPYILDNMAESSDPVIRHRAIANIRAATSIRAVRSMVPPLMIRTAMASPQAQKRRLVYDAQNTDQLPGTLVRSEGEPASQDPAVNEAYDYSGDTFDFYEQLFQRHSLDDNGMTLTSTVHVTDELGDPLNNGFWDGWQMAYGDGDGIVFQRFTQSLDVVAHELTHGVQAFTSDLLYKGESGALNEHFADVFGILVRQWKRGETVSEASWVIGADILVPANTRRGIRDMEQPGTAFKDDPYLGTDPQPGHISQIYRGARDKGGVHINSGIPNRAFVLAAQAIGGKAWEVAGRIWYETMLQLTSTSQFADCARIAVQVAGQYGTTARKAVRNAWKQVGITA